MRSIGKRAGLGLVHPHVLRAAFIMAALDAGVPLRDVQIAARHADPRTTTIYDRRRENFDRHAAYVVGAFVAGGRPRRGRATPRHFWDRVRGRSRGDAVEEAYDAVVESVLVEELEVDAEARRQSKTPPAAAARPTATS